MSFDYALLEDLFNGVWKDSDFATIVISMKVLGVSFVLLRFIYVISKNTLKQKTIDVGNQSVTIPITMWTILTYLFYGVLITTYDQLLMAMDSLFGYIVASYEDLDVTTINVQMGSYTEDTEVESTDSASTLMAFANMAMQIMNSPTVLLLKLLKGMAWIADLIIFGIFLGQRFFALLVLKFTGPMAIALSLFPGFDAVFGKWIALYARWFLLIIPYMLVNLLIGGFIEVYEAMFADWGRGYGYGVEVVGSLIEVPLIIFIVLLKWVLYTTGKNIYNSMIDYATEKPE